MTELAAAGEWLELNGRPVFYRRLAGGTMPAVRPLLLIHGISCRSETWSPLLDVLSRRPETPAVFAPDLPAHGRSVRPMRILGINDLAGWSARFLDHLRLEQVDVMGHSMGCQVALALAAAQPARVRRLLLLGPTTGGQHVSALRNLLGLVADSAREPLAYNLTLMGVFLRMGPLRYLLTAHEMQRRDAFRDARRVLAPSLVLQGSRDRIVPRRVAQELARTLPNGQYRQLPGAAHAAQFSHPELTVDALRDFLT